MKLLPKVALASAVTWLALAAAPAQAQINININPPSWGPPVRSANAQYYYIPEMDGYYDLRAQNYVYQRDGRWMRANSPGNYDPRDFHAVVVDYVGDRPWDRIGEYRTRYPRQGGNPHGMPPGQAKKMYAQPGYGRPVYGGYPAGKGKKYKDRDYDRGYERDGRRDDDDDDRGHGNGHGHGHGHGDD